MQQEIKIWHSFGTLNRRFLIFCLFSNFITFHLYIYNNFSNKWHNVSHTTTVLNLFNTAIEYFDHWVFRVINVLR